MATPTGGTTEGAGSTSAATPALTGTTPDKAHAAGHLRVLVVDDDPRTREMLSEALDLCGAAVCAVPNAEMARRAIKHWRPNAFVSDIDMPGESGIALIRSVRGLPASEGGQLPAIAFTGYARDVDRMLSAGFDAVVAKPVAVDALIDTILHVVGDSRARAEGDASDGVAPTRDS